jgi:hypothetical protein
MSTKVEMSNSNEITLVSSVLGLRSKARTVPPSVAETIRGLQGLLDPTKPVTIEWRTGGNTRSFDHRSERGEFQGDRNGNGNRFGRGGGGGRDGDQDRQYRRGGPHGGGRDNNGGGNYRFNMPRNTSANTFTSVSSDASASPRVETPRAPPARYQSRFKSSSEDIEEKILNRIIRLKLNKFGQSTFNDIREFLLQILGEESDEKVADFVKDFMYLVFSKAAAEEIYCPLYAQLLCEIGKKHKIIFEEMNRLFHNYLEIFEDFDTTKNIHDNESFEKHNIEKKYRQGYSQFIAELTALEILSSESLALIYKTLFGLIDKHARIPEKRLLVEEYVDCILRMSRVIQQSNSEFFPQVRKLVYKENQAQIDLFIHLRDATFPSLSPKARFLLMDILDILKK